MTSKWLKTKEVDKIRTKNIAFCEAQSAEKYVEEKRAKIIKKGQECDYQKIMHAAQKELEQEQNLIHKKKKSEQACRDLQWSQKLAQEVSHLKSKEINQQKRSQLLRLTSDELRQLEKQLRTAYNSKLLQIQLREKEANLADNRCQELQRDLAIKSWNHNDHSEQDNFVRAYEKREQYRKDLQAQLINNYQKKKQVLEEKKSDRKLIEEITQLLKQEEADKTRQNKEMVLRLRAEEETFRKAKEICKIKEEEALIAENNRIERVVAEKEHQKKIRDDAKTEKLAAKERMAEHITREILNEKIKRIEREDVVNTFYEEEEKISMQAILIEQSLEKQRLAKDLLEEMLRQKKATAERKAHVAAVDNDFTQYIVEQNQIAIKQEQDKIQGRRLRDLRYGEELKAEIERKEKLRQEEKRRKQDSEDNDKKIEIMKKQEILEEHSRLLQLNAPQLKGFLHLLDWSNFENTSNQVS